MQWKPVVLVRSQVPMWKSKSTVDLAELAVAAERQVDPEVGETVVVRRVAHDLAVAGEDDGVARRRIRIRIGIRTRSRADRLDEGRTADPRRGLDELDLAGLVVAGGEIAPEALVAGDFGARAFRHVGQAEHREGVVELDLGERLQVDRDVLHGEQAVLQADRDRALRRGVGEVDDAEARGQRAAGALPALEEDRAAGRSDLDLVEHRDLRFGDLRAVEVARRESAAEPQHGRTVELEHAAESGRNEVREALRFARGQIVRPGLVTGHANRAVGGCRRCSGRRIPGSRCPGFVAQSSVTWA